MKKKCRCSVKRWRNGRRFSKLVSGLHRRSQATVGRQQPSWKLRSNGCSDPAIMAQVFAFGETGSKFYPFMQQEFVRQYRASGVPEQGAGAEEKEAWEGDCDDEKTPDEAFGTAVHPADVGGSLGGGNPSTPRNGTRARDNFRSPRETKKTIKWGMKGSREEGWREGSGRREKRSTNSQGRDPKTFVENSQGKDPKTFEENSHGGDPRTFEGNS